VTSDGFMSYISLSLLYLTTT